MTTPFQFLNPVDMDSLARNSREFSVKSKFKQFTPTFTNFNSIDESSAYFALYGTMCYYFIQIKGTGPNITVADGVQATITDLPYGPISLSQGKTLNGIFPLACSDASGGEVVSGRPYAILTYTGGGLPLINMPIPSGTTISESHISISGWFIRD